MAKKKKNGIILTNNCYWLSCWCYSKVNTWKNKANELVPKAYRQNLRNLRKENDPPMLNSQNRKKLCLIDENILETLR